MTGTVLIQDGSRWLSFSDPVQVITATCVGEVETALQTVETAVSQRNLHAAGFITYEASAAYNLTVNDPIGDALPLLWFGLYEGHDTVEDIGELCESLGPYALGDSQPSVDLPGYEAVIPRIKDYMVQGHTYQLNYTFRMRASFEGEPLALFSDLVNAQQAMHTAYVDTGRYAVCSASPELFFRLDGNLLTSRPMKGTAARGRSAAEDKANVMRLAQSEKNRAENVMIVDMIRNDMGRVAHVGSVHVPRLFEVERYPTLLQMTSTVQARTGRSFTDIMRAMFPCASVTGAPKVRTMEIIAELEREPRGVYTGAIGYLAPGRQARFNVAIRTVVIDRLRGGAEYGVGSGIVWDSSAADEYEECMVKAKVLTVKRPSFNLLESLLWTLEQDYFLLDAHLQRLAESSQYFNVPLDKEAARERLEEFGRTLSEPAKVRLLVGQDGAITVQAVPLAAGAIPEPVRVGLAAEPVDSDNPYLYHKTTRREVYEEARASRPDCDDAILWNERGEITEATTSNVVLQLEGEMFTPPVESGLLAGTFRNYLLQHPSDISLTERVLTIDDLRSSTAVHLIDSVRRWRTAIFVPARPAEDATSPPRPSTANLS
ncbi:MAG: aminodeoxychorismate synthase component I [Armatimonadetes bacterium]|nr:aminodeoxychorismate synthase component I [Armatimonadota bacterium]